MAKRQLPEPLNENSNSVKRLKQNEYDFTSETGSRLALFSYLQIAAPIHNFDLSWRITTELKNKYIRLMDDQARYFISSSGEGFPSVPLYVNIDEIAKRELENAQNQAVESSEPDSDDEEIEGSDEEDNTESGDEIESDDENWTSPYDLKELQSEPTELVLDQLHSLLGEEKTEAEYRSLIPILLKEKDENHEYGLHPEEKGFRISGLSQKHNFITMINEDRFIHDLVEIDGDAYFVKFEKAHKRLQEQPDLTQKLKQRLTKFF